MGSRSWLHSVLMYCEHQFLGALGVNYNPFMAIHSFSNSRSSPATLCYFGKEYVCCVFRLEVGIRVA